MKKIRLKFDERGLIPAIIQDVVTKDVLMLAYMNEESLQKTLETGLTHFWSRSRNRLWKKGETSGNIQKVRNIFFDCDKDALLVEVEQIGEACHTKNRSCFFRKIDISSQEDIANTTKADSWILYELYEIIKKRRDCPVKGSYTNYLFNEGIDKILKKVGEETAEVIIGAKNASRHELIYEICDLLYHLIVLLVDQNIKLDDIFSELKARRTS